jgi:hypothetical protein
MCDCRQWMDAKLKEHNGRLAVGIIVGRDSLSLKGHLCVETEKLDKTKRKPVPKVFATFCPFCGEKGEGV